MTTVGLDFSALRLAREADGSVSFDRAVIDRICEASGIDSVVFWGSPEDNLAALIVAWYSDHRERGGSPDPVAEDLIAEARIEDERGGSPSHEPGRA